MNSTSFPLVPTEFDGGEISSSDEKGNLVVTRRTIVKMEKNCAGMLVSMLTNTIRNNSITCLIEEWCVFGNYLKSDENIVISHLDVNIPSGTRRIVGENGVYVAKTIITAS